MKEKEVLDENQRPIMGTDGKPKTEQVEVTVPHFKAVTVFDIAQTSGEPIQTLAPELLTAAVPVSYTHLNRRSDRSTGTRRRVFKRS